MTYEPVNVKLTKLQIQKLKKSSGPVSIPLKKNALKGGDHQLMITKTQMKKIEKARKNHTGVVIKMSKTQAANQSGDGIGAILASVAPALIGPAIEIGKDLLGGLFGKKGDGIYMPGSTGGSLSDKKPRRGEGLFLGGSTLIKTGVPSKHVQPLSEFLADLGVACDSDGNVCECEDLKKALKKKAQGV